jgi:maltooligosyltrehalose trehalohydrolase
VVSEKFDWQDEGWLVPPVEQSVLYELHVGTFTSEGTFDAVRKHLPYLRDLGVTCIELMPVSQFPGARNWGYDGVYPFAVQNTYGGSPGLKRLVNESHQLGLSLVMDVVYNHLGPEGNYLAEYGPYFSSGYRTPWGDALNFDGPDSDAVRRLFVESAVRWVRDFHIDGLRIDAVQAIFDHSAYPFLEEIADEVRAEADRLNRGVLLFAESDQNDPRLIRAKEQGGFGMDAQWADGFHHALRTLLTGDRSGYYADFGDLAHLAKAYQDGYVYTGQYSRFRRRRHGAPTTGIPAKRFVVFSQNHDQVGNRVQGERLGSVVSFEDQKLAAVAVILSPYVPLLFMGEEYGETSPFLYFINHTDPGLVEAIRRSRAEDFAPLAGMSAAPDPQAEETFQRSKVDLELRHRERHRELLNLYRHLLRLRRESPALANLDANQMRLTFDEEKRVLLASRRYEEEEVLLALCFSDAEVSVALPEPQGQWEQILNSADEEWLGPGGSGGNESPEAILQPRSAAVFRRRQ